MQKTLICTLLIALMATFGTSAWAVTCKELDTNEKIKAFVKKSQDSNPLRRENVSTRFDLKTDEQGKKKKQLIQSLRLGERKRTFFVKGKNAPQCFITLGERDYRCTKCRALTNSECRSYKSSDDSQVIRGTNIDLGDFDLITDDHHESVCNDVKNNDSVIKLTTKRVSGDSPYEKIISYYIKDKEVPITMNYYAEGVLRKVYRFYPKKYIQVKGEWVATVTRVRTTVGTWKKYTFQTDVIIKKNKKKKHMIYLDPASDPALKKANLDTIFSVE